MFGISKCAKCGGWPCECPDRAAFRLSADELSALIEACNVADNPRMRPRPPWDRAGRSAWDKLVAEEMRRGEERKAREEE